MLKQNTPEWLEMRKGKVGASDAPVIMQVSPHTTPYQLWQEKLELVPPKKSNWGMDRGRTLEDVAREEVEKITGLFFMPQVKFHATIPWMMASVDAIDPSEKSIAEIKCPGEEDHNLALQGQIPEKYFPQLMHQLEVCELEMGYYYSFDGTAGVLLKIYRDDKYIKEMIKKEEQFWEQVQSFEPPDLIDRDFEVKLDDPEWDITASEWLHINSQLKALEQEEKFLRDKLICKSNNRNCMGSGVKVSRYLRKGNVNYSAIPELSTVNLDAYRKKASECYRIAAM
jgi:putative phage-type endonuclease